MPTTSGAAVCIIGTLALALAAGCNGQTAAADPGPVAPAAAAAAPLWDPSLPPMNQIQAVASAVRGYRLARGIIHLHSSYSHDACDYNPLPGGKLNAPCLADLRYGLCRTRMDFAMLTDHSTHMTEEDFADLLLAHEGDGDVVQRAADGTPLAARWQCTPDLTGPVGPAQAGEVLITVGGENALMPVGLQHHVAATPDARAAIMTDATPQAMQTMQAAGALVLVAHGESHALSDLRALATGGLNGMEVYNLHANIDPTIRETYLGLPRDEAILGLAPWLAAVAGDPSAPLPDLALLGFLQANDNQIGKYNALLADGHHVAAMIGSDIHQNTLPQLLADGERGDGYRRLMRWFSNHLLIRHALGATEGPLSYDAVQEALRSGRSYGVFEVFGSPQGFDFHGQTEASGVTYEMGDVMPSAGSTLRVTPPRPLLSATVPAPAGAAPAQLSVKLLRVAPGTQTPPPDAPVVADEVLSVTIDAGDAQELVVKSPAPGAYRVEVHIVPNHLLPLLGSSAATFHRDYPYVYSNPIYVTP